MTYVSPSDLARVRLQLEAGLRAHREGDLQKAASAYRDALALAPEDADALNLLGAALLQLGDSNEAVSYLERAAHKQRNNPQVLGNLAQGYLTLHRHDDACAAFRKASRLEPGQVQFQVGLAVSLALQRKLSEAERLLQRLAVRFPTDVLVWLNLGHVMRNQDRPEEAVAPYRKALEIDAGLIEARNSLGRVLHTLLRFPEAEQAYRTCIECDPKFFLARYNLASMLVDTGRFAEAEAVARELVAHAQAMPEAHSTMPEAHSILGSALGMQGRLLDATPCYERALRLDPDNVQLIATYGGSLLETGRALQGLRSLSRALALDPHSAALRQLLGGALLAQGRLQDGWLEARQGLTALALRKKYADLAPSQSLPGELQGRHLCVLREQGLGDELFFLRYAPRLAGRGARLTYRASDKIITLLSRVGCIADVVPQTASVPQADTYILAGDLPHLLGEGALCKLQNARSSASSIREFPHKIALYWPAVPSSLFIAPLHERVAEMRDRLTALGPAPYIAITWRAGTAPETQGADWVLHKAIALPALADALSAVPGTLIAVQRNPASGEIAALSNALERPMHDFTALNEDLEGMLALLAVLDDYVGVSNTNMHLRAAVGKTARVLVPAPAEWRWMQSGRTSPWFPGFSIYRQSLNGEWTAACADLKRDLASAHGVRASGAGL